MPRLADFVMVWLLCVKMTTATAIERFHWKKIDVVDQKVLSARWTVTTKTLSSCASECSKRGDDCLKFSFHKTKRLCYLDATLTAGASSEVHFHRCGGRSDYVKMPDGRSCIKVFGTSKTRDNANNVCVAEGTRLVRVKTVAKREDLRQILTEMGVIGNDFWVDARRQQGAYVWGDGTPVDMGFFSDSEPSGENCVRLLGNLDFGDQHCGGAYFWVKFSHICEI